MQKARTFRRGVEQVIELRLDGQAVQISSDQRYPVSIRSARMTWTPIFSRPMADATERLYPSTAVAAQRMRRCAKKSFFSPATFL